MSRRSYLPRYLDLLAPAAILRVEAYWEDHGRMPAKLLDSDGDQVISLRDLTRAWSRLEREKIVRQDRIRRHDIPRLVTVTFSLGTRRIYTRQITPSKRDVPNWFAAMDRNGDGDISRREFLGKPADFEKLDADADGLIDAREAR